MRMKTQVCCSALPLARSSVAKLIVVVCAFLASGCAQVMAIQQPGPIDCSALTNGARRTRITGALGHPVATERPSQGRLVDTYKYTDGGKINSGGGKAVRVVVYTVGDVLFLFLTQLVWMPIELFLDGTDYTAEVEYMRSSSADNRWAASNIEVYQSR